MRRKASQLQKFLAQSFWEQIQELLAHDLWEKPESKKDFEGIRGFLGKTKFDCAIQSNDFEQFLSLFESLSADDLWTIRNSENRQPLGFVKTEPYEITEEDKINLKHYLDDIGFSGVVSLSDAKGTYTITPTAKEFLENASFSMNSISKVLTGALALMTMSSDDFKAHLKLDSEVLSYLQKEKEPLYHHLEKPSLLQTMNHEGGFGDYLLLMRKI